MASIRAIWARGRPADRRSRILRTRHVTEDGFIDALDRLLASEGRPSQWLSVKAADSFVIEMTADGVSQSLSQSAKATAFSAMLNGRKLQGARPQRRLWTLPNAWSIKTPLIPSHKIRGAVLICGQCSKLDLQRKEHSPHSKAAKWPW